jgi:uncharacterized protein GlcG (DUF336 family)
MTDIKHPTPDVWKSGGLSYSTGLTLNIAKKMLEAAEAEAEKQGVPVAIAITDSGGNLVAFSRMDNAALFSINIAMDKAFTAVFGKWPTGNWSDDYRNGDLIPLFFHKRWITFPGGFPIINNRVVLGGLGVSGGIDEDIFVARAALAAGGFSTDDADAFLAQIKARRKE